MTAVRLGVRQGTPEWIEARRGLISSTDIPILLGLSPYKSEGQLAREKLGQEPIGPSTPAMRAGSYMEAFVADEYAASKGRRVRRVRNLLRHPSIEWAVASIDREIVGERRMVEIKTTAGKRFEDEIPQDTEAQVRWALGVSGFPVADVAVWVHGAKTPLHVDEITHDEAMFENLVTIAADFRRRLAEGGPFAESAESLRALYPQDSGTFLPASPDLIELVDQYRSAKATKLAAEDAEKSIGNALRALIRDASGIEGLVTYRKSADSTRTNWPAVASAYRELLADHAASELDAIVAIHSETVQGPRVLRLLKESSNV